MVILTLSFKETSLLQMKIQTMVNELSSIPWVWTKEGMEHIAFERGWAVKEEDDQRIVFQLDPDTDLEFMECHYRGPIIEVTLQQYEDPHLLDECEYDKKKDAFAEKFDLLVRDLEKLLSPPSFIGWSGEDAFPSEQWAEKVAVWIQERGRFMTQLKQDDKELPIKICLVITP